MSEGGGTTSYEEMKITSFVFQDYYLSFTSLIWNTDQTDSALVQSRIRECDMQEQIFG